MRMTGSPEPLVGRVRLAATQPRAGNVLASFVFDGLGAAELERLEMALFDSILAEEG